MNKSPDSAESYYIMGTVLAKRGHFDKAIDYYLKSLQVQPDYDLAHAVLQQSVISPNALETAVICCQKIIKHESNNYLLHKTLGHLLTQQGQFDEASTHYQQAIYQQLSVSHPTFVKKYWSTAKRRSPDFMIIGITKAGTTSLYHYLTAHPQIVPAVEKEINFFDQYYSENRMDWYLVHFPLLPEEPLFLTGEATPSYLVAPEVHKRVFSFFPDIKLIVLLRNPIDLVFSYYQMLKKLEVLGKKERQTFEEVVSNELEILKGITDLSSIDKRYWKRKNKYLFMGLYVYFIEKWMKLFPKEQFLILQSEEFYTNPASITQQTFKFLGLSKYQLSKYPIFVKGSYEPMSPEIRRALSDFFQPHNQKLEAYLGRSFNWK
jgi:tetratricopeptide (TPR) repeat protein